MGEVYTRFNRQADFVPPGSIGENPVTVIGCGAIGRQVAIQLAAIGVRNLILTDFDTVTPTNVTTQGFLEGDVGKEKVYALAEAITAIDAGITVECICDRFRPTQPTGDVVFVCVDSIDARRAIWNSLKGKGKAKLILDGRMLGEVMQVLAVANEADKEHYETTLFPQEQQEIGRCSGHATIYCASIAAGLMVHQYTRYLRSFPVDNHCSLNLLAGELLPVTEL
jgi:sulfur carrier protein ThiS adenylyltransferase